MTTPLLMDLANTVYLEGYDALIIVDRRKLPGEIKEVYCTDHRDVARAIEEMMVQGAGDIAITAGYGLYLTARELEHRGHERDLDALEKAALRLKATRPTGHHLAALLNKVMDQVRKAPERPASEVILALIQKALGKQREISEATGRHGETLIKDGDTILTHCFAGAGLLHLFDRAQKNGKTLRAFCTETRPYLQGARLTAWSLAELGVETTLITDNMAAWFMARGKVDAVFTAADRIALDGSAANKVGTLQLAICARHFGIPFYILGYGGPDRRTRRGVDIPIEERDPAEVLNFQGMPITGSKVKAVYPAFDITPPELITGIVTTRGVFPPARMADYFVGNNP
ncbi:MAG: S-methyl-5-thioribose-1-phosphate isomerase [Syntrophales bacterium]|nr:S-methyl-5-thioribose-1-phosphate isomerase [Syntrophales bacterium]